MAKRDRPVCETCGRCIGDSGEHDCAGETIESRAGEPLATHLTFDERLIEGGEDGVVARARRDVLKTHPVSKVDPAAELERQLRQQPRRSETDVSKPTAAPAPRALGDSYRSF